MGSNTQHLIVLGVISGAHGIGGEVRVYPHNPDSTSLSELDSILLREGEAEPVRHRVVRARKHKKYFLLKVEGIDDRNQAEQARGREVLIPAAELVASDDDEFYFHELVGLEVFADDGGPLGRVAEILETAAHAVLVVQGDPPTPEYLVPFTEDAICTIDTAEKRVVVRREMAVGTRK